MDGHKTDGQKVNIDVFVTAKITWFYEMLNKIHFPKLVHYKQYARVAVQYQFNRLIKYTNAFGIRRWQFICWCILKVILNYE